LIASDYFTSIGGYTCFAVICCVFKKKKIHVVFYIREKILEIKLYAVKDSLFFIKLCAEILKNVCVHILLDIFLDIASDISLDISSDLLLWNPGRSLHYHPILHSGTGSCTICCFGWAATDPERNRGVCEGNVCLQPPRG
jgi:hypothetical protein